MTTLDVDIEGAAIRQRSREAASAVMFLAVGIPLGVLYLVALPIALLAGPIAIRRLTELERTLANRLLHARIPAPTPLTPDSVLERHQVVWLVAKLPLTIALGAFCAVPFAFAAVLLVVAVRGFAGSSAYLGPWTLGPVVGVVLLLLALPSAVLGFGAAGLVAPVLTGASRRGLTSRSVGTVPVREALAQRLGDRTLAIAYWLPEREIFVDEHGISVALPEPGSGRTWTAVEHHGTRVAAIIHDAELDARPELVEAAAAGAVLALDNERLKADLRARLEELRASRRRIVEASGRARRQLERDLHDGAQQQLVSLSLDLQMLRRKVSDEDAVKMVDATVSKLSDALRELRELARGIHPAVLSDRGLVPALEALADRSPIPVELELELSKRLPVGVETAAYFVAAEALTNVAKYSQATYATLAANDTDGRLVLEVGDDGIGGADLADGTGLRGLSDRVAALDGQLILHSPKGAGTRVTVTIPYAEGAA